MNEGRVRLRPAGAAAPRNGPRVLAMEQNMRLASLTALLWIAGAFGCSTECPEAADPSAAPAPATAGDETSDGHAEPGHAHVDRTHGHQPGHRGHRFEDPEDWEDHFEGSDRDAWQKPQAVLDLLDLEPDHIVADVGTGTGYFAAKLVERVPEGRVWAVDIEPGMVRHVNARAREQNLGNLFAVLGKPDDPLLPEPVDLVLVVDTYHHIEDRTAYFENLRSHLRPGGRVAIVDFEMGDIPVGPPEEMKIAPDRVKQELEDAGYTLVTDDRDTLPHQYILIASPK